MRKYFRIFIIICSSIFLLSCNGEDESVDITVMPPVTTKGAGTFGCLVDGWLYVGGRYWEPPFYCVYPGTASMKFIYDQEREEIDAYAFIDEKREEIRFKILNPKEKGKSPLVDVVFKGDSLKNGAVQISRFDLKEKIVSGEFSNMHRLTNGRFDVHFEVIR